MTFTEDGLGKIKILFIPLKFRWTFDNNQLKMCNAEDGTALDSVIEVTDDCIIMKEQDSVSYFYKD